MSRMRWPVTLSGPKTSGAESFDGIVQGRLHHTASSGCTNRPVWGQLEGVPMKHSVHFVAATLVSIGLILSAAKAADAQPDEDQAACINTLNAALRLVVKTHGKQIAKCVKDFAKGKTLSNPTLEDCTTADNKGRIAKATRKTLTGFGKKCDDLPPFGPDNPYAINEAGVNEDLELVDALFGVDLDAAIRKEDPDKAKSQCQQAVLKTTLKCEDTKLKTFAKCKKDALKNSTPPILGSELRDACMGQNGTPDGIPDGKDKIFKACVTAIQEKAFVKKCSGVDTSSLIIPQTQAEIDALVSCLVCKTLNESDNLDRDCDEFDDGLTNGSCEDVEEGTEVVCSTPPPLASGVCEVESGGAKTLIVGTVLTPGRIYRGGQLLVDDQGAIACVGCNCATLAAGATVVRCPQGVISPGLINTHEHISFAQNDPYNDTGERYEHRHHWRRGSNGHTQIVASGGATPSQTSWGELRHLMGGTTSMTGAGSAVGLVRNLDRNSRQEGLNQPLVEMDTFPLGDTGGQLLTSGCGYPDITTAVEIAFEDAFLCHVAEGIDDAARNEFFCLSSSAAGGQDLVQPQSAFVHLVGLTAADYAEMVIDSTKLIWSPRSNIALYGDTAGVTAAARSGVTIALGTDWIVSGSMNLLRELQCADSFSQTYLGSFFTDEELWEMVTRNAATVTATDDVIGSLETGRVADIAVFDESSNADYRAVIDAGPADVVLVMRGGKVLYGDAPVVSTLRAGATCDPLDVCGTAKEVCLLDEIGQDLLSLESTVTGIYPAFVCGDPTDEPSCTPMRGTSVDGSTVYTGLPSPADPDGDGIEEADNCPTVFNPVRPLDGGFQADSDADGVGDACDECPTTVSCP